MLLRYALLTLAIALPVHAAQPLTVDWLDLLPAEDYQAMLDMPDIEHGFGPDADGNFDTSLRQREGLPEVMYSTRVVGEYDGKELRIGGYPVPLETDDQGRYTSLFLVPYAGACIHVPPPPPNQIIHVKYREGFTLEALYDPVWIEGELVIERTENDLGTSSYSMVAQSVEPYTE